MGDTYGPWATAIASAPLSSFWRRRLYALPTLAAVPTRRGRWLSAVGLVLLGVPLALPQQPDPARATIETPVPRVKPPAAPPADESAEKREVRAALHKAYALADKEALRIVRAPFPPERSAWLQIVEGGGLTPELAAFLGWSWDETRVDMNAMASPSRRGVPGRPALFLVTTTLQVRRSEIEGPGAALLDKVVWADVILRGGTPYDQLVAPLSHALREQLGLQVRLTLKTEKRDVWVVRGQIKGDPAPGARRDAPILIYGKEPPPPVEQQPGVSIFATTGDWGGLLNSLAVYVGRQVIADDPNFPRSKEACYLVRRDRSTDPGDEDAVIKKMAEQTGLTFTRERRDVRVLWVEKVE